jgi:Ca-activated chloride channel family protein
VKEEKYKIIIALMLGLYRIALASSADDSVYKGNALYDSEHFNEALKEYDQALIAQPQALEPKFNKADCYFQLDDLDKATDLYNEVAADSKDMKLVEKAKYNLGNCYFQQGSKQKDSNLQKALEDLRTSIVCWRSALEINPENKNAAKNIEVARLTIKDIIDRLNKQKQEQQKQAQKQKQIQQQLKELAEQQKALAQKTQQTKKQADQKQISQQQAQDSYDQQEQEQSQIKNKTEQTLQQMQQQDPNNPQTQQMQQASAELNKAVDAQSNAEKQLKASDGGSAKESQDKAAEHLDNALKELSKNDQQQQQQKGQQRQTQQPQGPNQPDQQQKQLRPQMVDTTAQEILDKEQKEKKQRPMFRQGGYQKVDKDW